ncbi:hypothetical protein LAZ67_17000520 [Cordylochernes scorpioides]|uniref:Uncharacterized protein n=1 Tax=Cordylochernes scorpioides TaxID=51811 RepID=A0ABY6LEV7_9ARAC|nr:hypothetical protein LAZ67_17000520 [Cordylochernes scorpioides]
MLQWPPILAKVQHHQRVQVTKWGSGTFVLGFEVDTINSVHFSNHTGPRFETTLLESVNGKAYIPRDIVKGEL